MAKQNHRILVPEARHDLNKLKGKVMAEQGYTSAGNDPEQAKYEVADDLGVPLKHGYNGDMKAKEAGKVGGNIGGQMVREMIQMAEQNNNKKH